MVVQGDNTAGSMVVLSQAEGSTLPVVTSVQSHQTRITDKVVSQSSTEQKEQPTTIVSVTKKSGEVVLDAPK